MSEQVIENFTDRPKTPESVEQSGGNQTELESLFRNYRKEKLRSIDNESQVALKRGETKLAGALSFGYSVEQVAKFRTERGLGAQLANNQQQVEQLQTETKAKIENLF